MTAFIEAALARRPAAWPGFRLRIGCAAAVLVLAACGGGGGEGDAVPASGALDSTAVMAASIDRDATEVPVDVRVAQGVDGNAFVVWRTTDGTRHNLWASRYSNGGGTWSDPVRIESTDDDIGKNFDVWVDSDGNASVLWSETSARFVSARFDAAGGGWSAPTRPVITSFQGTGTEVAFNVPPEANGTQGTGFYFDPVNGTVSSVLVESLEGSGFIEGGPVEVDGRGHAIGIYGPTRVGTGFLIGNYYSESLGGWLRLRDDQTLLEGIPGSTVRDGDYNNDVQLTPSIGDDFLAAWQVITGDGIPGDLHVAHFTPVGRTWSGGGPLVAGTAEMNLRLQRLASNRSGETRLLTWTQNDDGRTALKALRLFRNGEACETPRTLDAALGGSAARVDVAVASSGNAIAVWQQFEGGRIDDGSRSNVAFSRFDAHAATWQPAVFAEARPGNADAPRVSAGGDQAVIAWVQAEGDVRRVKVLRQPL